MIRIDVVDVPFARVTVAGLIWTDGPGEPVDVVRLMVPANPA